MEKQMKSDFIQTYTGKAFELNEINPRNICIEDIAKALSQICRFTGHTKKFYSVAEHCILGSFSFEKRAERLAFLLHDAEEAYLGDMSRPFLNTFATPKLQAARKNLRLAILKKYGAEKVYLKQESEIKKIDTRMLVTERNQVYVETIPWREVVYEPTIPGVKLQFLQPAEAEIEFLRQFEILRKR